MRSKFCITIGSSVGPMRGAPRLPRIGWGEVTSPLGLRLITGSVAEGGGGAELEDEAAGAPEASPAKSRVYMQAVGLSMTRMFSWLPNIQNIKAPFIQERSA